MRLRLGLAAWSNSHFDHALYPLRTPHVDYLPRYARLFSVAEADVLHHQMPDADTLREWIGQTPEGFLFLPKMHKDVTHGAGGTQKAQTFLDGLGALRDAGKLGPILLQFPPGLDRAKGAALLQDLLRLSDPGVFAVEVRNTSWFTPAFENLLEDFESPLVWSTFPGAFTPPWATAGVGYIRFTGKHIHTRGRHVTVADRLGDILEVRKRLAQASWKECFAIVTNPFEGNAVDSLPRIAAALGETELARRCTREPGQPLLPDARQRTLPGEA
jgi:uncharacterized protein YecE (DUF72 family)